MKRRLWILFAIAMSLVLTGCCLSHKWTEADCDSPKTCARCGQTEGTALGHRWEEAGCTLSKICAACSQAEGEPLGHRWEEASCAAPQTCSGCGMTAGEPLEHVWTTATCSVPQTCVNCGHAGDFAPHNSEVSLGQGPTGWEACFYETCLNCGGEWFDPYDTWEELILARLTGQWGSHSIYANGKLSYKDDCCLTLNPDHTGEYDLGESVYSLTWRFREIAADNAGDMYLGFSLLLDDGTELDCDIYWDPAEAFVYMPNFITVHSPPSSFES